MLKEFPITSLRDSIRFTLFDLGPYYLSGIFHVQQILDESAHCTAAPSFFRARFGNHLKSKQR